MPSPFAVGGGSAAEIQTAAAPAAAREEYRFEFRGATGEYFRIWIVNVLFSILTLGIYSAWAKVRNKRYFYGNTYLAGANFEYHANPLSILVARLIVFVGIIGGGGLLAGEDPVLVAAHSSLLLLLLPWAMVRGFAFNARNSSYRGIRFGFHRRYAPLYLIFAPIFIPLLILNAAAAWWAPAEEYFAAHGAALLGVLLLLFIFAPAVARRYHQFKAENHFIGNLPFCFHPPKRGYILALWIAPAAMIVSLALLLFILLALQSAMSSDGAPSLFFPIVAAYAGFLFWTSLIAGKLFKMFWSGVAAERARVVCDISVWRFAINIQLINYLAMILTLGLATPWARVRKVKYLAENMRLLAEPELMAEIAAAAADKTGALGEAFDEAEDFDFDVGLI